MIYGQLLLYPCYFQMLSSFYYQIAHISRSMVKLNLSVFVFATVVIFHHCDWTETRGKTLPFTSKFSARSDRDSSVDNIKADSQMENNKKRGTVKISNDSPSKIFLLKSLQ